MSPYVILCWVIIAMLAYSIIDSMRRNVNLIAVNDIVALMVLVLIAMVFFTLSIMVENEDLKITLHELKFIGVVSIPYVMLSLYSRFTDSSKTYEIKSIILGEIIPLITMILVLTNKHHHLFRIDFYFVNFVGGKFVNATPGVWFYVHTAYTYFLSLIGLSFIVRKIPKTPKIYREQLWVLIGSTIFSFIVGAISISGIFFTDYGDSTLLGFCVTALVQYYWIIRYSPKKIINMARNLAVGEINSPILVFDNNDHLMDSNLAANERFKLEKGQLFSSFVKSELGINADSETIENKEFNTNDDACYLVGDERMFDEDGKYFGRVVYFNNVSEIKLKSKKLARMATYDNLTGLYNSTSFYKEAQSLTSDDLPAVFVMFNINDMHFLNTMLGNKHGDRVIIDISSIILKNAPRNSFCARIEGDEFCVILKKSSIAEGNAYIEKVQRKLKSAAKQFISATDESLPCNELQWQHHDSSSDVRKCILHRKMLLENDSCHRFSQYQVTIISGSGIKIQEKDNVKLILKAISDDMLKFTMAKENATKTADLNAEDERMPLAYWQFKRDLSLMLGKYAGLSLSKLYSMYENPFFYSNNKDFKSHKILEISNLAADLYINKEMPIEDVYSEIIKREGAESEIAKAFFLILQ